MTGDQGSNETTELTETEAAEELTQADTSNVEDEADIAIVADVVPVRRRTWARVASGALAALMIASVGLTAWLYFSLYRPDQQTGQAASDTALDAAKDAIVAVLSYTPESLDKDLDNAKSHLTGNFLTYYTQFTDQVVRPAVKTKQVSTTANVVRAAVSEMSPDEARVLVFVNQTTTSSERAEPSMAASSVVVTLDKVDGKWLISAFDPV